MVKCQFAGNEPPVVIDSEFANFFAYVGLCVKAMNRFSKLWKKLKKITFST